MAYYHLSMSRLSRKAGRSAVAAVAYISADKMHDARQDMDFDYRRKERVLLSKAILPNGEEVDASSLWNAVELSHKRGDAVTAYTIDIALPHELDDKSNELLLKDFAEELAKHYGVGVQYAMHRSKEIKNIHAHVVLSACSVNSDMVPGKKVNELDYIHCKKHMIETSLEVIRPYWAEVCNTHLERAGLDVRIDHRSHHDRGLSTLPTIHEGFTLNAELRKEINRQIRQYNRQLLEQTKAKPLTRMDVLDSLRDGLTSLDPSVRDRSIKKLQAFVTKVTEREIATIQKRFADYREIVQKKIDEFKEQDHLFREMKAKIKETEPWRFEEPEMERDAKPKMLEPKERYQINDQRWLDHDAEESHYLNNIVQAEELRRLATNEYGTYAERRATDKAIKSALKKTGLSELIDMIERPQDEKREKDNSRGR